MILLFTWKKKIWGINFLNIYRIIKEKNIFTLLAHFPKQDFGGIILSGIIPMSILQLDRYLK